MFYFDMDPVAKGRIRIGRYGPYTPNKTTEAQDSVRMVAMDACEHDAPLQGPLKGSFLFVSASPTRKKTRIVKVTKPDVTNLVKLIEDALLPQKYHDTVVWQGIYHDDSQLVWEESAKMYCWAPNVHKGVYVYLKEMDNSDLKALIDFAENMIRRIPIEHQ